MTNDALKAIRKGFIETLETFVSDTNMIAIRLPWDDKHYLKKTKYRIEIRSDESSTWLAYVMRPTSNDNAYKEYLANKYIDLVNQSDDIHFNMFPEVK